MINLNPHTKKPIGANKFSKVTSYRINIKNQLSLHLQWAYQKMKLTISFTAASKNKILKFKWGVRLGHENYKTFLKDSRTPN